MECRGNPEKHTLTYFKSGIHSALIIKASRIKWHMIKKKKKSVIGLFLFEYFNQGRIIRITKKHFNFEMKFIVLQKSLLRLFDEQDVMTSSGEVAWWIRCFPWGEASPRSHNTGGGGSGGGEEEWCFMSRWLHRMETSGRNVRSNTSASIPGWGGGGKAGWKQVEQSARLASDSWMTAETERAFTCESWRISGYREDKWQPAIGWASMTGGET